MGNRTLSCLLVICWRTRLDLPMRRPLSKRGGKVSTMCFSSFDGKELMTSHWNMFIAEFTLTKEACRFKSLSTSVLHAAAMFESIAKRNEFGSSVAKEHCLNQARVTQARQSARNCRGGGSSRSPGVKKEWRHEQQ